MHLDPSSSALAVRLRGADAYSGGAAFRRCCVLIRWQLAQTMSHFAISARTARRLAKELTMRAMYWTFSTSGLCSTSITKCEPAVSTVRGWRALRSSYSARCGPYRTRTGDLLLDREASTPDCSNRPWPRRRGLHPRPPRYERGALLAELRRSGGGGGTRTRDLELMRLTSYQLLHTPMGAP